MLRVPGIPLTLSLRIKQSAGENPGSCLQGVGCNTSSIHLTKYGLTAEGENSVHNRSARELKDDLIAFLHLIAAYLPFSYVTERFEKNTNSLEQVFNIIAELYNAEVTNDSFLDLAHMIKLSTETHRQYFERLAAHVRQHLTGPQVSVENFNSGRTGDSMNITIMNMVVIIWLSKIDSRLI